MSKELPADVRVKYFPTDPGVTQKIQEWAKENGVRILSVVPVYWEDVPRE
jgi:TusA-related sulfurtransferase